MKRISQAGSFFSFKKVQKIVDNFLKSDRLVSFIILGGKVMDE